jgi:DNA-directed RNA polymerase alpha subunit
MSHRTLRTCSKGHKYYKSSDCPTCPICEKERKPQSGLLADLSAPARRALENNGIDSLEKLSELTEKQVLKFHGIGKTSIPKLKAALNKKGLDFKSEG